MAAITAVKVRTRLIGQTQLAMHNVQLANPDNYWAKEIAKLTSKRIKTEEDRLETQRLEFLGGLYLDENRLVIPKANVRRCFKEAARATRKGKDIDRALNLADPEPYAPLVFPDDTLTPEELLKSGKYTDITSVGVSGRRIMRTRPVFPQWAVSIDWLLLTNLLDFDQFSEIARMAGIVEGLGDNRVNGWGRFQAEVIKL